jgi:ubiquinone/menaquinone biosynthesis C-methylase UbiE
VPMHYRTNPEQMRADQMRAMAGRFDVHAQTARHRSIAWRMQRKAIHAIRPSTYWSLFSWTEQRAIWSTISVRDPKLYDRRSRELADELRPLAAKESVLLDIGCGIGRPQRYLAPYVAHIYGTDIAKRMLAIAAQRHQDVPNVSWHRIDGESLRFAPDSSIDLAYSELVFQHVDKPKVVRLWADLFRVLKPGGMARLQLPNLECSLLRRGYVENAFDRDLSPGDMRPWTAEEVQAVATELGFIVESVEPVSDARGPHGECLDDEVHAGYSLWLTARKPGIGAKLGQGLQRAPA